MGERAKTAILVFGAVVLLGGIVSATIVTAGGDAPLDAKSCIDDNDFGIDAGQGEDDCFKDVNGLHGARALVISPDGKYVYAASEVDDAIAIFKRDKSSGKLKPKGCVDDNDTGADPLQGEDNCAQSTDGLSGAGGMAISDDGKSLYAVGEADDAVVRFERNKSSGALTPGGCVDDNDGGSGEDVCGLTTNGLGEVSSIAISPDDKNLYAVSEGDDAIVRFTRDKDSGTIAPQTCIDDNDTGADTCAQGADGMEGATGVAISANGKSVYASSEHDNAIAHFSRSGPSGAIAPEGCIDDDSNGPDTCTTQTNGLASAETLVVSPKGDSVFLVAEGSHAVLRFARNKDSGKLKDKGCIEDKQEGSDACSKKAPGLSEAGGLAISPNGKFLYVAAGGDDALTAIKRKSGGSISVLGCVDDNDNGFGEGKCGSKGDGLAEPEGVVVSPDGKHIYVAAEGDDAVVLVKD